MSVHGKELLPGERFYYFPLSSEVTDNISNSFFVKIDAELEKLTLNLFKTPEEVFVFDAENKDSDVKRRTRSSRFFIRFI
jgi:hypothetical protein